MKKIQRTPRVSKIAVFELKDAPVGEGRVNDFLMLNPRAKLIFISEYRIIYKYESDISIK